MSHKRSLSPCRSAIEWPTWIIAVAVYGGWLGLTLGWSRLPLAARLTAGAYLVAWHGSLQHETIHGHPTRSRRVNALLGAIPLGVWFPYGLYRETHLRHHAVFGRADASDDPESMQVSSAEWQRAGRLARLCLTAQTILLGRLVIGPAWVALRLWLAEARRFAGRDLRHLRHWAWHLLGLVVLCAWLRLCHVSLVGYALLCVYPGVALTLLRSFAEHRAAAEDPDHRTAIVDAEAPLAILYLFNNLHVVHHAFPGVAWYRLPALYRAGADAFQRSTAGFYFRGYRSVIAWFALRCKEPAVRGHRFRVGGLVGDVCVNDGARPTRRRPRPTSARRAA